MSAIDLDRTYVHLDGESAHPIPAEGFWQKLAGDHPEPPIARVRLGGWLVGTFPYDKTWDFWEMHPEGDELVTLCHLLLWGALDFVFEDRTVPLAAGQTVIVPRGAWHRAIVKSPGAALHVTFGRGTQHRPLER